MKKKLFLILFGVALLGCSSDDNRSTTDLIGIWDWVASSGGIAGNTETPESTGNQIRLEISSTTIKRYLNGTLTSESEYVIETRESIIFQGPREMIIEENEFQQIIERSGNNLILIGDCNDCFTSEYLKR
ncbi:MAG: hypothetical protein ACWA5P_07665 [bacterium]